MSKFDELYESLIVEGKKTKASSVVSKFKYSKPTEDLQYNYSGKNATISKETALLNKGLRNIAKWVDSTDFSKWAQEKVPHKVYRGYTPNDEGTNFDDKATIMTFIIKGIPKYWDTKLPKIVIMAMGMKSFDLSKYVVNGKTAGIFEDYWEDRPQIFLNFTESSWEAKRDMSELAIKIVEEFPIMIYSKNVRDVIEDHKLEDIIHKMKKAGTYKEI